MKNFLQNALLVMASVILCLLAGEIAARTAFHYLPNYDFEMWRYAAELKQPLGSASLPFRHAPNRKGRYYGVEIATDSLGFRDHEYSLQKPQGKTRILFLGDSHTLGWGVPLEETVSKTLEQRLNSDGDRYEVINMGVGNYNSSMEVELFKTSGLRMEPDIVILMYYINDTEPTPAVGPLRYILSRHSFFLGHLWTVMEKALKPGTAGDPLSAYYRKIYAEGSEGLSINRKAIRELQRICKDRGVHLLIVNIPELRRLRKYPFAFATEFIQGLAEESGTPFLDLLQAFAQHEERELWVSPEDPHMNSKAHALAAEAIYKAIRLNSLSVPQAPQ